MCKGEASRHRCGKRRTSDLTATREFDNFDPFAAHYEQELARAAELCGMETSHFVQGKVDKLVECETGEFGGRMLDLGCGVGRILEQLQHALPQARLYGTDVSEKSLEAAAARGIRAQLTAYDGARLTYPDNHFEAVLISMVLHHIAPPAQASFLLEARRVLTPNGRLYVFEHNPWNPVTRKVVRDCPFDEDAQLLSRPNLLACLRELNFRKSSGGFLFFIPPLGWLKKFTFLDRYFEWCPLGAQYFVRTLK